MQSPAFRRALAGLLRGELRELADARIADLFGREHGRRLIRQWDARLAGREAIAELAIDINRGLSRRLARRTASLLDVLDPALVADFEAVLAEAAGLTPRAEAFIAALMRQDFMRGLFTDLIYSALVSFYQRVDPFFGALGVRALEPRIKSFIGYFMPMLQERATAFAIAPANRRLAAGAARVVARQLLDVPLGRWAELAAAGQRQSVEAFMRRAARNVSVRMLVQQVALAVWDELYGAIGQRTVGDVLRLDAHATWAAQRVVDAILPILVRPAVLAFIGAEATVAAAARRTVNAVPAIGATPRRRRARRSSAARRGQRRQLAKPS